jgi:hypothetical protein
MRRWLPLLLALAIKTSVAAQPQRSPFEGDARLEKRVTVRWKKATLQEALQELSQATEVRLSPDRPVADEPIMASATEVEARVLLEQLGRLLHFTWARSGGTRELPNYLLYRSQADREAEEAGINGERRAVLEALKQEFARERQASRLTPEQRQRELEKSEEIVAEAFSQDPDGTDPATDQRLRHSLVVHSAVSPIGGAMMDLLDSLTPAQWILLLTEQPVIFSSRPVDGELPLPGPLRDRLRAAVPELPLPKAVYRSLGPEAEAIMTRQEQAMHERWRGADGFKATVDMSLSPGTQPLGILRVSPAPLGVADGPLPDGAGPLAGIDGLTLMGSPRSLAELVGDRRPAEDPGEREKRLAADPVLGKKAVLKLPPPQPQTGPLATLGQAYRVADVLPAVEEAFGIRLVGDAYSRQAIEAISPPGNREMPFYQVLDLLAGDTRTWERDGDVIRLRSRTWAHDRRAEIPVRSMQRWLALRAQKGGFSLDDVAEIATTLRDEQVASLVLSAQEAGSLDLADFFTIQAHRDALRFYGSLLLSQRQRLQAGQPLPIPALSLPQQRWVANLIRMQNRSMLASVPGAPPGGGAPQQAAALLLERQEESPAVAPGGTPDGAPTTNGQRAETGSPNWQRTGRRPRGPGEATPGAAHSPVRLRVVYILRILSADGPSSVFEISLTRAAASAPG